MKKPGSMVILGSGGHALAVWDASLSAGFTPIGFVDPAQGSSRVQGLPVVLSLLEVDLSEVDVALGIVHNFARQQATVMIVEK